MLNPSPAASHLNRILQGARFEILPFAGVPERVVEELPTGSVVTVTCSPKHGIDRTLEATEFLAGQGYVAVPHLAASCVRNRAHLHEIVDRLVRAGVDDAFVIGGDGQTGAGAYPSALRLLADLRATPGCPVRLGIAGYPEGHPSISEAELLSAVKAKAELASYVVTQMCFDARAITSWVARLHEAGVELPVLLGAPGAVARRKLIEMSARIGVGTSARFLTKNVRSVGKLLVHRTFDPGDLLAGVAADAGLASAVTGVHLFTFNQVSETSSWLESSLEELAATNASA